MSDDLVYRILVTHPEVPAEALELISHNCEIIMCTNLPPTREEILQKVDGVDGILWANNEPLSSDILVAAGPQLKVISTMSPDLDFIDVDEVKARKIALGYTPKVADNAVADLAIGLMLAAARRFREARIKIENSDWQDFHLNWMLGQDISNATVGFFGFGSVAKAIAKRLIGFDIGQIFYQTRMKLDDQVEKDFKAKRVSFDLLLEKSDILFVTAPLTEDTRNTFNYGAFAKMKKTAIFVNVSNGAIVNQTDLIGALKSHQIFAAGIDVMVPEPLGPNDPLLNVSNLIVTPHIGSATTRTRVDLATMAVQNILKGLANDPLISSAY